MQRVRSIRGTGALVLLALLPACGLLRGSGEAQAQANLREARSRYERDPTDEDAIVWLGRRLGYVGRYEEAVEVFTRGLEIHPGSAWLYRFRGHRYITLRRFGDAVADLMRADELAAAGPDVVEPDGQPNAAGIPIGSLRSNVDYHLGLAHYLRRDFAAALEVYERGRERAQENPDRTVSLAYWTWLTRMQLGQRDEAAGLLRELDLDAPLLENEAYRDLLRLFRGELAEAQLLSGIEPGTIEHATRAYGVAMARLLAGDARGARGILETVVEHGPGAAFGCIAAEVELAALGSSSP